MMASTPGKRNGGLCSPGYHSDFSGVEPAGEIGRGVSTGTTGGTFFFSVGRKWIMSNGGTVKCF